MTLAMKTAFCIFPRRLISLLLLYFNLVINLLGIWFLYNSLNYVFHLLAVECFCFSVTIITIHNKNSSLTLLIMSVFLILVDFTRVMLVFIGKCAYTIETQNSNGFKLHSLLECFLMLFSIVLLAAFKLYSALVCYSYKEELELDRRSSCNAPSRREMIYDEESLCP